MFCWEAEEALVLSHLGYPNLGPVMEEMISKQWKNILTKEILLADMYSLFNFYIRKYWLKPRDAGVRLFWQFIVLDLKCINVTLESVFFTISPPMGQKSEEMELKWFGSICHQPNEVSDGFWEEWLADFLASNRSKLLIKGSNPQYLKWSVLNFLNDLSYWLLVTHVPIFPLSAKL